MSNQFTIVVGGMPTLTQALASTRLFANVVGVDSTGGLRQVLQSKSLTPGVEDKIFIFADNLTVDTPQTLSFLIGKLTAMRARVIILGVTPNGRSLVAECPGAGLLDGLVFVNSVLGAIASLPGVTGVSPVPDVVNVQLTSPDGAAPSVAPAFETSSQSQTPVPNPFGAPPAQQTQPAAPNPFSAAPAAQEAPSAPNPFGAPPAQQAPQAPNPFGAAPAAQEAPSAPNPFGAAPAAQEAPSAPNPFGAPPAQPPAAPNPFGAPPTQQAPQAPNPFGPPPSQEAPPAPNPFGPPPSQEAPAAPNPFGGVPAVRENPPAAPSPFGAPPAQPPAAPNPFGAPPAQQAPQAPFGTPAGGPPAPRPRTPLAGHGQPGPFAGAVAVPAPGGQPGGRRGWVVTVTAPKGGTGKSTLSLNMAAYLGLRLRGTGKNVCIIDANVQQADTGKYLNAYTPNVEDLLRDPSAVHPDRIGQYLLHKPQLNLSALLGPATPDTANPVHFTGRRYEQILQALKPNFDYIFIDTPVAEFYHQMFQVFALPNADFIVVAVTPNVPTLVSADMWLRQVTAPKSANGMGIDESRIGVTLNRAEEGIGCSEDEVRANLAEWRYLGAIPETKEWKLANNACELVVTKNYHELNEAFAHVLAQATGETWLTEGMSLEAAPTEGLGGKFKRLFKGRKG